MHSIFLNAIFFKFVSRCSDTFNAFFINITINTKCVCFYLKNVRNQLTRISSAMQTSVPLALITLVTQIKAAQLSRTANVSQDTMDHQWMDKNARVSKASRAISVELQLAAKVSLKKCRCYRSRICPLCSIGSIARPLLLFISDGLEPVFWARTKAYWSRSGLSGCSLATWLNPWRAC